MKQFLLLLILCPIRIWAQTDTLTPIRRDNLKLIESDLLPAYNGRYGRNVRTQYTYDGLDVRRTKDLGQYIFASGDPDAIREFNSYISSRKTGGWLIASGLLSAIVGVAIMSSNSPGSNGKFTKVQPCPPGYLCSGTLTVTDTEKQNAYASGGVTLLVGSVMAGIGWGLNMPGNHVRRSVQYYNRALKQRGISWQLTPYSSISNSGVGLVGRF